MSNKLIDFSESDVEKHVRKFDELLNDIENIGSKKKELWRNIYMNALSDRQNAFTLFGQLYDVVTKEQDVMSSTEMAVHGKTLTSYLERMSKANDQLIKLADLIAMAEEKKKEHDIDDAYKAIGTQ